MINWSCKCPYRTTVLCRAGYWMRWRTVPSWRHDQDAGINLQVLVGWRNAFGHRDDIFTLQVWGYVHEVHNHWLRAFMAPSVNGQRIQEPAQQKLVPYGHFLCLTLSWMFLLGHLFMSSVVKALLKTEPVQLPPCRFPLSYHPVSISWSHYLWLFAVVLCGRKIYLVDVWNPPTNVSGICLHLIWPRYLTTFLVWGNDRWSGNDHGYSQTETAGDTFWALHLLSFICFMVDLC